MNSDLLCKQCIDYRVMLIAVAINDPFIFASMIVENAYYCKTSRKRKRDYNLCYLCFLHGNILKKCRTSYNKKSQQRDF